MNVGFGRKSVALAASTTLAAGLLTVGTSAATAAPMVSVNDCGSLETKPKEIVLACADANEYLDNVRWKSWKKKKAKGRATYKVNDCDPTCADGTWESYKVRVTLRKPRTQSGERVYSQMILRFPKTVPDGMKKKQREKLARYVPVQETPTEDAPSTAPDAMQTPAPNPIPGESMYETPEPSATESPDQYATPTATPTPTPTPTDEYAEAEEMVDIAVVSQNKISGRLRVIVEAESSAGGDRRGIESVKVERKNDVGGTLTYEATWAGPYRPTTWTAMTGCNSNYRDAMTIEVTTNSGKVATYRTDARSGC